MSDPKKPESTTPAPAEQAAKSGGLFSNPIVLYAAIGIGSLVLTVVVLSFLMGPSHEASTDTSATSSDEQAVADSNTEHTSSDNEADEIEAEAERALKELDAANHVDSTPADASAQSAHQAGGTRAASGKSTVTKEDTTSAINWIEAEKTKLNAQRLELEKREHELAAREETVNQKLTRLAQAETARISELAKLYDSMKPEQVARLVAQLDDKTIVAIIPRMKPVNASKVLGALPPERAARISRDMITLSEK